MTEADWLTGEHPVAMLRLITENPDHCNINCVRSDRKLRLFAAACCRLAWHRLVDDFRCPVCDGGGRLAVSRRPGWAHAERCEDCSGTGRVNRSRRAVEVAERYADGQATKRELVKTFQDLWDFVGMPSGVWPMVRCAADPSLRIEKHLPHTWFTPPAAQAALLRDIFGNPFRPVTWAPYVESSTVLALARAAYDERQPDGMLDPARLAILADALDDAGCSDAEILNHLRSPGPHARGCWAVDLLLGKE